MSKAKYIAPSVELIQFGNEDLVCVISGWDDGHGNHFGIVEEGDGDYGDGDF